MIFKQHSQVLDGSKTQTRRIRFPYDLAVQLWKHGWSLPRRYRWADERQQALITQDYLQEANRILKGNHVTLPVIPGRGKKAVGKIRPLFVWRERLQAISEADVIAEGIHLVECGRWESEFRLGWFKTPIDAFRHLWNSIHKKSPNRWEDDPGVIALKFELA